VKNLIQFAISFFFITSNVYADKTAECAATYFFVGQTYKAVGMSDEAKAYSKLSKKLGNILLENYGQAKSESLIAKEITLIQQRGLSNINELGKPIEKKLYECHAIFLDK
jgi:hypothetical protein